MHRPEFGFPSYENILQYICKRDQKNALTAYFKNENYLSFTRCPLSPMLYMKMQTGEELMKQMDALHLRDRTRIMKWMTTEEFKNVM
jgi:hypothetical protein